MSDPCSETLGIELENEGSTTLVEFTKSDDQAFSVGSSAHAGMRINRAGVAPIEFYIQREGNALWLVPAYASLALRLDARRVTAPRKLSGRCLIELSTELIIVLRVHEAHELGAIRAAERDDMLATRLLVRPQRYVEDLPAEGAATRVAMPAVGQAIEPLAYLPTEAVPVAREDDVPEWQKTIEIPVFRAMPWAGAAEFASKIEAIPNAEARPRDGASEAPALASKAPPPRAAATVLDMRPSKLGSTNTFVRRIQSVASKLGMLARQRPLSVAVGSLTTALALSFSLVAATGARIPAASKSVRPTAAALPSSIAPVGVVPPTASVVPSVRVHPAPTSPPTSPGTKPPDTGAGPADPELAEAIAHLIAGRDSQAKAAYARLARRSPDDPAYAVAARLLERLAVCTNRDAEPRVSCPKVER